MSRTAAVDFGGKRIGLAVSDESGKIALPLKTVAAQKSLKESAKLVLETLKKYAPVKIVVGLPLLLSGERGSMANLATRFAKELEELGAIVEFLDERLSTAQADRSLKELDFNRKQRSRLIDAASATLLLQTYLAKHAES